MLEKTAGEERRDRAWPGIVPPLFLTAVLVILAWLFAVKVESDRKASEQAMHDLAARARLWAKTVLEAAERRSIALASARLTARKRRERELLLETRSVLDAAHRLLAPLLDRAGRGAAERRPVGAFPSGLDAVRTFLETAPIGESGDRALAALRASGPELASLLPAGCRLSVVEDYSRELFSTGGTARSEKNLSVQLIRDFVFNDGAASRNWAIRVETSAPDDNPPFAAAEMAERLAEPYTELRANPAGVSWLGWLVGPGGLEAASFPPDAGNGGQSRLPRTAYEWLEAGDGKLVWLEAGGRNQDLPWRLAVAAVIDQPGPPPEFLAEIYNDSRWGSTLAILAFFSLAGWLWFVHSLVADSRETLRPEPAPRPALKPTARRAGGKYVLVRNPDFERDIPDDVPVTIEIGDDGEISLQKPSSPGRAEAPMPSGSLFRLQSIHRGGQARKGSRVLDQARTQTLRELADRVRSPSAPVRPEPAAERGPAGRAARMPGSRTAIFTRAGQNTRPGLEFPETES